MHRLLDFALAESGAQHFEVTGTVAVARREGEAGQGYAMVGYTNQPATVKLDGVYSELISGELYEDEITLKPYQVAVLKRND